MGIFGGKTEIAEASSPLPTPESNQGPPIADQLTVFTEEASRKALKEGNFDDAIALVGVFAEEPAQILSEKGRLAGLVREIDNTSKDSVSARGELIEALAKYVRPQEPVNLEQMPPDILEALSLPQDFARLYAEQKKVKENILTKAKNNGSNAYSSIAHGDALSEIRLGNESLPITEPVHNTSGLVRALKTAYQQANIRPPEATPTPTIEVLAPNTEATTAAIPPFSNESAGLTPPPPPTEFKPIVTTEPELTPAPPQSTEASPLVQTPNLAGTTA